MQTGLHVRVVKQLAHYTLDVAFSCPLGETIIITGPSGSGKSTLLRCIAGLEQIDEGTIIFNDGCWNLGRQACTPQRRHLGFLGQEYGLFPQMTVEQNIRFAACEQTECAELLADMGISHLAKHYPLHISGGERQRAALCQTLASKPQLLLLDEPFSALDVENRSLLKHCLRRVQEQWQLPIVQITHDLSEALSVSSQVLSLKEGHLDAGWFSRQREVFLAEMKHVVQCSNSAWGQEMALQ